MERAIIIGRSWAEAPAGKAREDLPWVERTLGGEIVIFRSGEETDEYLERRFPSQETT